MQNQHTEGEKIELKRQVEISFQDPFNDKTIPYEHYLPNRSIETAKNEETIIE